MERYRPIVDDWDAFTSTADQEKEVTIRRNPLQPVDGFEDRIASLFPRVEQAEWNERIYRVGTPERPGANDLHRDGHYYVQEESAALAVDVLDPQPGDRILDLCAAPGGKTTQIAARVDDDADIVANDDDPERLRSLRWNLGRLGVESVEVTNYDGRQMPLDTYDRILVDAPCSAEGVRYWEHGHPAPTTKIKHLASIQRDLVKKAASLLARDGVLVYATCTFAPLENEDIVSFALERTGLEVEPIDLPVPHTNGCTAFDDATFHEEVAGSARIYPHHLQSGGSFIARFRG